MQHLKTVLTLARSAISDIPALNFDPGVLEIAGTLAYSERRFCNFGSVVKLAVRDGFSRCQRSFSIPCRSSFRRLNPPAGETIPLRESKKPKIKRQPRALLLMLKFVAPDAVALSQKSDGAV